MQDGLIEYLQTEEEMTKAYIMLKKEQRQRRIEEIKRIGAFSGGTLLLSLGIGFEPSYLACLGIGIPAIIYQYIKMEKDHAEEYGFRYAKYGISKKLRELQATHQASEDTNYGKRINKKEQAKLGEYIDLYYTCGRNMQILNNKEVIELIKDNYLMLDEEEIDTCIRTLKQK